MAVETVSALTELTSPAANDEIGIWDVSAGEYKKIQQSNLVGATITGGGTIALGGYTLTVPATGTAALLGTANTFSQNLTISKAGSGTIGPVITLNNTSGAVADQARIIFSDNSIERMGLAFEVISGGDAQLTVLDLFGSSVQLAIFEADGDLWVANNVSAASFTDRTPYYDGDALAAVAAIAGSDGEIDHSSLPEFARTTGANGEPLRDIGGMLSVLTVAVQQLLARVEALEAK